MFEAIDRSGLDGLFDEFRASPSAFAGFIATT
jgi:hypothetical protein